MSQHTSFKEADRVVDNIECDNLVDLVAKVYCWKYSEAASCAAPTSTLNKGLICIVRNSASSADNCYEQSKFKRSCGAIDRKRLR